MGEILTVGEVLEKEKKMVLDAAKVYGDYFINANEFNHLLHSFIKSVDLTKYLVIAFFSQVKKHHTLALFSSVRQHHIQTGMNLRQVCEAGAWMCYAMAHMDEDKFVKKDENGLLSIPQSLERKRNKWLLEKYPEDAKRFQGIKDKINESVAHSNLVYTIQNFKANPEKFETPFFDFEDKHLVKTDLWFVANIALGLLDLFLRVNQEYKAFTLIDNFMDNLKELSDKHQLLK